jgi:acyl-coenzyme A thioesterase PaaI-like protein
MEPFETTIALDRTFDALYGLEILEHGEDRVVARVAIRDEIKQPMGLVHGGLNAAMGLSNSTSFLRPITSGEYVHATATRRHRGRTTWVWDVDITDDEGRLCATTRMTIAVRGLPKT